ncbi:hypothetical protein U1Q18_013716 [Sarracenia purpurea var. burkii]
MGNHKFRLSAMMPNAWFYKLKDMGRTRNQNTNPNLHPRKKKQQPASSSSPSPSTSSSIATSNQPYVQSRHRKSYYFTRDLTPPPPSPPQPQPPPPNNRASNRTNNPDSTPNKCPNSLLGNSSDLHPLFPEFGFDHDIDHELPTGNSFYGAVSCSSSCRHRVENGVGINVTDESLNAKFDGFIDSISELKHPPAIVTKKPAPEISDSIRKTRGKKNDGNDAERLKNPVLSTKPEEKNALTSLSVKVVKEDDSISTCRDEQRINSVRRQSVSSPGTGVRLRTNSPRIASRKMMQAQGRKSVSSTSRRRRRGLAESLAVVKSSADPRRDFRESMVEMILQNNLRTSKDLEELLAYYLELNSDKYHELIIQVFMQIWFELGDISVSN